MYNISKNNKEKENLDNENKKDFDGANAEKILNDLNENWWPNIFNDNKENYKNVKEKEAHYFIENDISMKLYGKNNPNLIKNKSFKKKYILINLILWLFSI